MLVDTDGHDHVAVLAAVEAGSPLAAQADLLAVAHTRRDADLHGAPVRGELHGGAGNGVAQVQRGRGQDVGALLRLGLGAETTEAEGAGAATGAGRAGGAAEHAQQVVEVGLVAGSAGLKTDIAALTAEHGGEDVLESGAATGTTWPPGLEARTASGHGADRVVLLALGLVGQNRVRLPDLLEPLRRRSVVGVTVGVVLLRERTVGLLDGGGVGVLTHAEDRVEVLRHPVLTGHVRVTASLSG